MAQITDGFREIFLAGIGALAMTGDKAKEVIDQLIAKGEITVEQGKQISGELKHKAEETATSVGSDVLDASMKAMSPEQRAAFAARVSELAAKHNAQDSGEAVAAEVEAAVEEASASDEPTA